MTILELIQKACKAASVPETYAERIQKTFKIEKAEGIENYVNLFKDNILPAITEAGENAKKTAKEDAIKEYESKYKIKDGKSIEKKDEEDKDKDKFKGMDPELKAMFENMNAQMKAMGDQLKEFKASSQTETQRSIVLDQIKKAGLPESWLSRVDLESETSVEDQVKALTTEYTDIQQKAIDKAVGDGDYTPSAHQMADRSEEDWQKFMDADNDTENNPGVVDLGI